MANLALKLLFPQDFVVMTSYRTDKTSKVILALFMTYALGYGIARNQALRLVSNRDAGSEKQYIVNLDTASASGWEYNLFLPAVKLEETVRYIVEEIGSYF